MRITHLSLTERERQLAAMRAAQARISLSAYVGRLIIADAEKGGLAAFLDSESPTENGPEEDRP